MIPTALFICAPRLWLSSFVKSPFAAFPIIYRFLFGFSRAFSIARKGTRLPASNPSNPLPHAASVRYTRIHRPRGRDIKTVKSRAVNKHITGYIDEVGFTLDLDGVIRRERIGRH
jgi:hypothetical protein